MLVFRGVCFGSLGENGEDGWKMDGSKWMFFFGWEDDAFGDCNLE